MATPEQVRKQLQDAIRYVRSRIYTLEDYTARSLLRQYEQAFVKMDGQLQNAWSATVDGATWSSTDAAFIRRTQVLTSQIADEMARLNQQVHDTIIADQINAYRASFYGNAWIVDRFTPRDYNVDHALLPTEAIRAQMLFPYENNTTLFRLEANRTKFIQDVRSTMVASQINGDTIYQAQKRLADALGLQIGRRTAEMKANNAGAFNRTEMIARTELLRGSNLGSHAVYEANKDVVKEWEYIATLDARTCPICGALDGNVYPLSDTEHLPPRHPLCRCSQLPVTVSFADLGLPNVPEMGVGSRASMFGPVRGDISYSEWAMRNGIMQSDDGGLRDLPPTRTPMKVWA